MMVAKTVELNISGTAYASGGTWTNGTGSSGKFTISPAQFSQGSLAGKFNLIDKNEVVFLIQANKIVTGNDELTVTGTPANTLGDTYKIVPIAGYSGFYGGTSLILDAEKIDADWMNSILTITRPVSKTTQKTPVNNGNRYTYANYLVTNTTGAFDTSLKAGDVIKLEGVEYAIMMSPISNTIAINPIPLPAASGTLVCYKMQKEYGVNLKKFQLNISVDGWLTNDYVHHPEYAVKRYAEEKAADLFQIAGVKGGDSDYANLVFRENSYLGGRYCRFVSAESGTSTSVSVGALTDTSKAWATNQWVGYTLTDSNSVQFAITANIASALTVTGGSGTPKSGGYKITNAVNGCMACTRMKLSDTTKACAPLRGGDGATHHVDKIYASLSFRAIEPK